MTDIKPVIANPLEPFVILAKSAKGAAAVELVKQVLDAKGVYVFGELLDMPNIIEVIFIFCFKHFPHLVTLFDLSFKSISSNHTTNCLKYLLLELTSNISKINIPCLS